MHTHTNLYNYTSWKHILWVFVKHQFSEKSHSRTDNETVSLTMSFKTRKPGQYNIYIYIYISVIQNVLSLSQILNLSHTSHLVY